MFGFINIEPYGSDVIVISLCMFGLINIETYGTEVLIHDVKGD